MGSIKIPVSTLVMNSSLELEKISYRPGTGHGLENYAIEGFNRGTNSMTSWATISKSHPSNEAVPKFVTFGHAFINDTVIDKRIYLPPLIKNPYVDRILQDIYEDKYLDIFSSFDDFLDYYFEDFLPNQLKDYACFKNFEKIQRLSDLCFKGEPDLFVFTPPFPGKEKNTGEEWFFCEVKSKYGAINPNQKMWMVLFEKVSMNSSYRHMRIMRVLKEKEAPKSLHKMVEYHSKFIPLESKVEEELINQSNTEQLIVTEKKNPNELRYYEGIQHAPGYTKENKRYQLIDHLVAEGMTTTEALAHIEKLKKITRENK